MTAELIGILTVGVALAALHVTTLRGLRSDLRGDARAIREELDRAPGRVARRHSRSR